MSIRRIALSFLGPLVLSLNASECLAQPQGAWAADFARPDMDGVVLDLATFDDGNGPKLYAAGEFTLAGGVIANHMARWNGTRWSPLGTGLDRGALALAVYDDGQGPGLYVGGSLTTAGGQVAHGIARWNGTTWTEVGGGLFGGGLPANQVNALAVYDDGSGRELYATGNFSSAGGVPVPGIAKWNGSSWSSVGPPTAPNGHMDCLQVFDDGSGPALYVGGNFQTIGGVTANNIARWNGTSWSAVGNGSDATVPCLAAYDDGSGPKLYAGGAFGPPSFYRHPLGRWDGSTWSPVGPPNDVPGSVHALAVFDDGSGPRLGIGYWGGTGSGAVGTWDGTRWSLLSGRTDSIPRTLTVHDDGTGPALYMGGALSRVGKKPLGGIARWDGSEWSPVSSSPGAGGAVNTRAMTVFDDGSGPALFAGGWFHGAGGSRARHVAKWTGAAWSEVGDGPEGFVQALAVHDDGSGPALYAAGQRSVERWNGSNWSIVGAGFDGNPTSVFALAVFDDGGGPELYAAGDFTIIGSGFGTHLVAKWDGSSWISIAPNPDFGSPVMSLGVFDDGTGPALYAGGSFDSIGGVTAYALARWDGSTWSPVGGGVGSSVMAMTVFDDGSGPALYVGGNLSSAGGVPVDGVARWDGSAWSAAGLFPGPEQVYTLAVHDDGSGPALYAGGVVLDPSSFAPRGVARLEGTRWRFLGAGTNGDVFALTSFDAGAGADLYAGGQFSIAGRHSSPGIARWKR